MASRTFLALRERNARLFFGGLLVSNVGTWAQATATALLVARLDPQHAGRALGTAIMLQFLPMLVLGAWAGAVADRTNRRRMTIATQTALTLQAAALAALDFSGHATLPSVYALSLVMGVASAMDNPARRGLVLELVDEEHFTNAMSLNTAVMTGSRIFGPALAAGLVSVAGTGWCFMANAISFLAVLGALLAIDVARLRIPPLAPRGGKPVRDGLRYVRTSRRLLIVFVVMAAVSTFGFNYPVALPLLAKRRFDDESAFGILLALSGLGSFLGSLLMASRARVTTSLYLGAVVLFGAAEVALAWSPGVLVAYALSIPMGFGGAMFISGANILVQDGAPPTMRSRLLAFTGVAFLGSTPIGGPITGWIGDHVSAEWSLAYGGLLSIACAAIAAGALARGSADVPSGEAAVAVATPS